MIVSRFALIVINAAVVVGGLTITVLTDWPWYEQVLAVAVPALVVLYIVSRRQQHPR